MTTPNSATQCCSVHWWGECDPANRTHPDENYSRPCCSKCPHHTRCVGMSFIVEGTPEPERPWIVATTAHDDTPYVVTSLDTTWEDVITAVGDWEVYVIAGGDR